MLHDFYSKLSNQEKMFLYVTLGVIVLAVFDFLFLQPVVTQLKTLDGQIAQTKDDIKRDVRYLAYKDKIYKENEIYHVYQPDEAKTEDQIFSAFLGMVENFAREVEVNPGKLNPGDVVHKKGYAQYFANMECSGKFENLVKLIHKIDTTPNLLKVVKLNIVGKKSSADEVTVIMKISKLIIDSKSSEEKLNLEKSSQPDKTVFARAGQASSGGSAGTLSSGENNSKAVKSGSGSGSVSGGESSKAAKSSTGSGDGGGGGGTENAGGGASGSGGSGGGGGGGGEGNVGGGENAGGGGSGSGGVANSVGGNSGGGSGGSGAGNGTGGSSAGGNSNGSVNGGGGSDNMDGESGAAGSSSGGASSNISKSKTTKTKKSSTKSNSKVETKKPTPLNKVASGDRMQVKSIESLWNDFWGIKPKIEEEKPLTEDEKRQLNSDEYENQDEDKPNLLRRTLDNKK